MELPWFIKSAFAGLGPLIWHWGIGVGVIIIILAVEYFSAAIGIYVPFLAPLLEKFRKDLLWVAVAIALVLAGEYVGARDMKHRYEARGAVLDDQVTDAVGRATKTPGLDRWDTDK